MLSPVSYHSPGRNREVGRADDPDSWAGIKHAFVVATAGFLACRCHRWRVAADLWWSELACGKRAYRVLCATRSNASPPRRRRIELCLLAGVFGSSALVSKRSMRIASPGPAGGVEYRTRTTS